MSTQHTPTSGNSGNNINSPNTTKHEVARLMASGMKPSQVANTLNLSGSYISQLADDEEFKELFAAEHAKRMDRRSDLISRDQRIDDYIQKSEEEVIKAIYENIEVISKRPERAIKLFQTLNSAKRKSHAEEINAGKEAGQGNYVQLQLPEHIRGFQTLMNVEKNTQNEVVQINDRVLKSTPTAKLFHEIEDGSLQERLNKSREAKEQETAKRIQMDSGVDNELGENGGDVDVNEL